MLAKRTLIFVGFIGFAYITPQVVNVVLYNFWKSLGISILLTLLFAVLGSKMAESLEKHDNFMLMMYMILILVAFVMVSYLIIPCRLIFTPDIGVSLRFCV